MTDVAGRTDVIGFPRLADGAAAVGVEELEQRADLIRLHGFPSVGHDG